MSRALCPTRVANPLTSSATTAKPRPCSPACAASIAALSARSVVWSLICRMTSTMFPMRFPLSPSSWIRAAASSTVARMSFIRSIALATASPLERATRVASVAFSATCWMDALSSVTAAVELSVFTACSCAPSSI